MNIGLFSLLLFVAALVSSLIIWLKQRRKQRTHRSWRTRFSGLQWRMTFSYIWITVTSVLVFTLLISSVRIVLVPLAIVAGLIFWLNSRRINKRRNIPRRSWRARLYALRPRMTHAYIWTSAVVISICMILLSSIDISPMPTGHTQQTRSQDESLALVKQVAQHFADNIQQQASGHPLGGSFPYPLGQPLNFSPDNYTDANARSLLTSDIVPYLPKLYLNQAVTFALLIAPDQRILSSSYPARYPIGAQSAQLLPTQEPWISQALHGKEIENIFDSPDGAMVYAASSVFNQAHQPMGAVYVQVPLATLNSPPPNLDTLWISLFLILGELILLAPLGGIFGFISTRGLVRRLKMLARATTLVADGDYQQHLVVASKDEIGQLEQQFNRMAEQLSESTALQQKLAAENARLAERSRISRELHDAISQDLFSLSMLAGGLQSALPADSPLQHQATVLEQTTNNTIREMRALLLELRPTRLEQLGLVEALEELATAYSTRLSIRVRTSLAQFPLEARTEHTLLRIAQEALANAARHANATEITVTLALNKDEKTLLFRVHDNGQGLQTTSENARHGLGLRLMQERVQESQGTFNLTSIPDQGTTLEVLLPAEA